MYGPGGPTKEDVELGRMSVKWLPGLRLVLLILNEGFEEILI